MISEEISNERVPTTTLSLPYEAIYYKNVDISTNPPANSRSCLMTRNTTSHTQGKLKLDIPQ